MRDRRRAEARGRALLLTPAILAPRALAAAGALAGL
jgi:hypothetical protein